MKHTFIRKLSCLVFIFAFICISSSAKAQCLGVVTIAPAVAALPAGTVGDAYSQQLTQSGLNNAPPVPVTWSRFGVNNLPLGLSINTATGLISGTPTSPGTTTFIVNVSGRTFAGNSCFAQRTYSISVACPVLVFTNPNLSSYTITIGTGTSFSAAVTGTAAPVNYSITINPSSSGFTINATTGLVSVSPTNSGTYSITVVALGVCSTSTVSRVYTVTVTCGSFVMLPINNNLNSGTSGVAYLQTLALSGSAPTIGSITTWSLAPGGGSLPPGLTLGSSTGVISGTPAAIGSPTASFTFQVNASYGGCLTSRFYALTVNAGCPTISVSPATSAFAYTVGTAITNINFSASGGATPYAYAISAGALPAGINIVNGLISGAPTTAGTGTFTVRATDANACTGTTTYTFTACPTINVSPVASALTYTVNTAITNINLSANGGATPYRYTISAGALPAGINIASGVISGTPTTASTGTFTVRATDDNNCTGVTTYTFTVNPVGTPVPPPVVPSNPTTSVDNSFEKNIKISPNPSKTDFSIDFGGLNMNKTIIRVYDMQGKVIYVSNVTGNLNIISLDKSNNGMYLLEIQTENERITKRIVKQ